MAVELQLGISPEEFLAHYWQRKPLLVRQAIANFEPPVDADTLAGLALEEEIESRIIESRGGQWGLFHGPFDESDFQRAHPWTLLVQAVDYYLPEVEALRRAVPFLPHWRIDDVMVSYAVDGGSVGPHYDNYDVFLLQGEGRRRWRVGQHCDGNSPLIDHEELRILSSFECSEEFLLEPGDMLYIPPRVAHWGVAEGECTTFSIGFRAPQVYDLVSRLVDATLESLDPQLFFADPGRAVAVPDGEITAEDLQRARRAVIHALEQCADPLWFGELVTEPRYEMLPEEDPQARQSLLNGESPALLAGGARLAWLREGEGLVVFANGHSHCAAADQLAFLQALSQHGHADCGPGSEGSDTASRAELLDFLLEVGCIHADRDEPTGG